MYYSFVEKHLFTSVGKFHRFNNDNIDNYNDSADIVNALSIIHWIYSCTSIFGSMENMILCLVKCKE